jgi:NAD(P)-dependent dehydrogenase (short-subunit alcohol dehydrogenase family)
MTSSPERAAPCIFRCLGRARPQEFDREGARVAICGLNEGTLRAAKETLGAGSLAVRADVPNLSELDAMFATIVREFGHLDGVPSESTMELRSNDLGNRY